MSSEFYTGELENLVIELKERIDDLENRIEVLEDGKPGWRTLPRRETLQRPSANPGSTKGTATTEKVEEEK